MNRNMGLSLPKSPSEDIMKSLIRASQFFDHAKMHAFSEGEFDYMIAIHNLDNAVEYMLRIIIRHLEIEENTGKSIDSCELSCMIGEISKYLKEVEGPSLSCVQELKTIRVLRNMVQHAMVNPEADIRVYLNYAEKFFNKSLEKYFGLSINELQYSSLIKDDEIKNLLFEAEKDIKKKNYLKSVVNSRNVFELARFKYISDYRNQLWTAPALAKIKDNDNDMYLLLIEMNESINVNILGLDTVKYRRFCNYCDCIPSEYTADWIWNAVLEREWNDKDAQFCYSFVANAVLTWQSRYIKPIQSFGISSNQGITYTEKINGISIDKIFPEKGCVYAMKDQMARLFFLNEKSEVDLLVESFKNGKANILNEVKSGEVVNRTEEIVEVIGFDSKLVMNKPATWQLIVVYKKSVIESDE